MQFSDALYRPRQNRPGCSAAASHCVGSHTALHSAIAEIKSLIEERIKLNGKTAPRGAHTKKIHPSVGYTAYPLRLTEEGYTLEQVVSPSHGQHMEIKQTFPLTFTPAGNLEP